MTSLPLRSFVLPNDLPLTPFCLKRSNAHHLRQRLPVPRMRTALSRTYERGVGLGDLHGFRDLTNFLASERWLNSLNVTFLRQPARQSFRVPPHGA